MGGWLTFLILWPHSSNAPNFKKPPGLSSRLNEVILARGQSYLLQKLLNEYTSMWNEPEDATAIGGGCYWFSPDTEITISLGH